MAATARPERMIYVLFTLAMCAAVFAGVAMAKKATRAYWTGVAMEYVAAATFLYVVVPWK